MHFCFEIRQRRQGVGWKLTSRLPWKRLQIDEEVLDHDFLGCIWPMWP